MSIAYGGIIAFLFRGMNLVVALATVIVTSNQLGADGRGTFVLGLTAIGVVNALSGGLTASVAYQVANQRRDPGTALVNGGSAAGLIGVAAIVLGAIGSRVFTGEAGDMSLSIGIASAGVIMMSVIAGVYLGSEALVRYNLALVAPPLISLIAIIIVIGPGDASADGALAAFAAGQWIAVALMLLAGAAKTLTGVRIEGSLALTMMRFGLFAGVASGISFLNYRADVFVVERFEGKDGVALYANAVYIAESVWQLSGSLALATYARIGSLDREAAAALTARVMRHTVLMLSVVCLALFLAAGLLVDTLFPEEYAGTAPALRILLPGTMVYGLAASFSAFYTYQRGKPWAAAIVSATGLAIDIGLALLLVPRMGVNGAALASAIAYSAAMTGGIIAFALDARVSPAQIVRFGRADVEDYRLLLLRLRAAVGR